MSTMYEDKKCRLCGLADLENENIFYTRDRFLVKKIAAVYSIWVTPNDPLPKCICPKCYEKINSTYKNYLQVKKLQTKWLENVAITEPNNNYIQVLNFIERANISIKNFIETNYDEKLCKDVIENLLISALSEIDENAAETFVEQNSNQQMSDDGDKSNTNGTCDILPAKERIKSENEEQDDDEEENFTLAKIATNKRMKLTPTPEEIVQCKYCPLKFESIKQLATHQISHMKISTLKLFQPKCLDKNFRRGRLISLQSRQSIRCLNCYLVFDDNKCILEHWSKAECDFFCQICGEEFAQSPKSLREHVSEVHGISYRSLKMQRDLSFLSLSNEQQPMLNKSKQQKFEPKPIVNNRHKNHQQRLTLSQPAQIEVSSSSPISFQIHSPERSIKCRICNRDFRNFKACNSHMRAHKPPYAFNDTGQLPDLNTDAYMEPEPFEYDITPVSIVSSMLPINVADLGTSAAPFDYARLTTSATTTATATVTTTPTATLSEIDTESPPSKLARRTIPILPKLISNLPCTTPTTSKAVTTSSTAPRGIRMKFVNRRSDLNGNMAALKIKSLNDLKSTQNCATVDGKSISTPAQTLHLQYATALNNTKTVQTVATYQPQQILPLTESQPIQACFEVKSVCAAPQHQMPLSECMPNITATTCEYPAPNMRFGNLNLIHNFPTTCQPALTQHTSVIVNSLQNQGIPPYSPLEPPPPLQQPALPILHDTIMSASIKDEPMEFI